MPDTKGLSGCGTHLVLIIGEKFVPSVGHRVGAFSLIERGLSHGQG